MKCPTIPDKRAPVHPDLPPPVSVTRPTLQPGHWEWGDGAYLWAPAEWVARPQTGRKSGDFLWQDGYWTPAGGACIWNAGHFVF